MYFMNISEKLKWGNDTNSVYFKKLAETTFRMISISSFLVNLVGFGAN